MHLEDRLSHNWLAKKLVNDKVLLHAAALHGSVIDLGCGTRPYESEIVAHAAHYVGLDWANTLHGLRADIVADVAKPLPIRDLSFDHAVAFEVLEHLPEPAAFLAEVFRILRPGGGLLLSVPFQWWVHEAPWDYYRFTRHGLEYLLAKAGFVDIDVQPTSGFWSMWVLKLNYQSARLVRGPKIARVLIRAVLTPFWWIGQTLGPALDRVWPDERETAGYFVSARKP